MERLTERTKDGYVTTCFWETNTENGMYDLNEQLAEKCIDRLAAYEDTGLTPEEVTDLMAPHKAVKEPRALVAPPPNTPLTPAELREMPGPVWICYPQETFGPQHIMADDISCTRYQFSFADYGKTWLAYRRKPEEENDASTLKNIERLLGDVRKSEKSLENRVYAKRSNQKEEYK